MLPLEKLTITDIWHGLGKLPIPLLYSIVVLNCNWGNQGWLNQPLCFCSALSSRMITCPSSSSCGSWCVTSTWVLPSSTESVNGWQIMNGQVVQITRWRHAHHQHKSGKFVRGFNRMKNRDAVQNACEAVNTSGINACHKILESRCDRNLHWSVQSACWRRRYHWYNPEMLGRYHFVTERSPYWLQFLRVGSWVIFPLQNWR